MPQVRRAERSVDSAPLSGGRRTAAETAASEGALVEEARADTGRAVADFGERAARVGGSLYADIQARERHEANQTALLKANNRLAEWKTKRLFDPTSGAFARRGEAALPLPEEIQIEFEQIAGEIEAGLGNADQKAAFARLRDQEWQGLDLQVRRHVFGEMQTFRAEELKGLVANATNAAILSASDPKLVAVELQKATAAIRANGPGLGMSPEMIEAQVRAAQSQTHVGVISALLAQDKDRDAATYFEATRAQIDGEKVDDVIKALDEGTLRGAAQKASDAIIAAGGTLTTQRAKAREIADPKLRDQVEQRIEHNAAVSEREEREAEQTALRNAYNILDKTPNVARIPPALWASFDGNARSAMIAYARTRAKGEPVETDLGTYYALMQYAMGNPAGFAKEGLLAYRSKLGEAEFKQLAGLQLSIANGDRAAADKALDGFRTNRQILEDNLTQYGIDPKAKPDSAEGRAIAQLQRMVDLRVEALQTSGKKVTNLEVQQIFDTLLGQTAEVPGSFWSLWSPQRKRLVDLSIDDVPAKDRKRIEQKLRERNRPVTNATILDVYLESRIR